MQIQKWIARLAHLFFLILGLIGISLMYINGNFGLGLTGIGSVPYEDTAEFNTQFNNDLNDIFLYMEYQDVDTGILIEHGFNFLNPRVFNGQNYVAKHFFAHFL